MYSSFPFYEAVHPLRDGRRKYEIHGSARRHERSHSDRVARTGTAPMKIVRQHRPVSCSSRRASSAATTPRLCRSLILWAIVAQAAHPYTSSTVAWAGEPERPSEAVETISGTLESVDRPNRQAVIRTDLGRPIFLTVTKPELLDHLVQGDRVTVQVTAEGEAIKIIEAPVPELRGPALR